MATRSYSLPLNPLIRNRKTCSLLRYHISIKIKTGIAANLQFRPILLQQLKIVAILVTSRKTVRYAPQGP